MKYYSSLLLLLVLLIGSCQGEDDPAPFDDCGPAIANVSAFSIPSGDGFDVIDLSVEGTCLTVTVGASGCSSDDWTMELVTDGAVAESFPTQTTAQLIFDDAVDGGASCLAYFNETYTFDLSPYLTGALPTNLTVIGPDTLQSVLFVE